MTRAPEEKFFVKGPAGRLEAVLRPLPGDAEAAGAAILFHPHPLFGGTLANKTLYRIALRLPAEAGIAALRVNFRGVGKSEGSHDDGEGELADALAGIEELAARYPGLPLTAIGYSFGAVVGLRAAVADERVTRLVALGLPLDGRWDVSFLERTAKERIFVQGANDEFGGEEALRTFAKSLTGPVHATIIPGASHLFEGVEDRAVDAVIAACSPDS